MTKILEINHKEVILDQDVFDMLKTFTHPGKQMFNELPLQITRNGYVRWGQSRAGSRYYIFIHHLIVGRPIRGLEVDHRNRNPLDNRKDNLRIVTNRENKHNRKDNNNLVGVHWHKEGLRFRAEIKHKRKSYHLGLFKTEQEAHLKYVWARNLIESGQIETFLKYRLRGAA